MGGIRPYHENGHAIVAVTFAIEFTAPPPPPVIRDLVSLHSKLKEQYPRKRESTGAFALSIEGSGVEMPRISSGFVFDSLKRDGTVERSIRLQGTSLQITRGDYTRWDEIWPQVRDVLSKMLPIAMEHVGVTFLGLGYQDQLLWDGDRSNFSTDMVFRNGSKFLAPHIFQVADLWHSYHGYFEYPDRPQPHQSLHVIEAQTRVSEEEGFIAMVNLNHRAQPGAHHGPTIETQPIEDVNELLADDVGLLNAYMNKMHDDDKTLLEQILNDHTCELIGLVGRK